MGLLNRASIQDGDGLVIQRQDDRERVIALAGNPNVGKSTVFNALTGLNQHTGNWPGKTVANAQGRYRYGGENFILVDIPGTYSLMANSLEEEVARDFICFGEPDTVVVVTDATCLERNLNLVLQVLEVTGRMVVCVNLMDEAKKKGITIDLAVLSRELGVPVVGASARQGKGLPDLMEAISQVSFGEAQSPRDLYYGKEIEEAIALLMPRVSELCGERMNPRWACLKLLDGDDTLSENLERFLGMPVMADPVIQECLTRAREDLGRAGIGQETMRDQVVSRIVCQAERVYASCVNLKKQGYDKRDRRLDRLLTSRATGIPVMIALLALIFWLTITGANYPSQLLSSFFGYLEGQLTLLFSGWGAPAWLHGLFVEGMFRTLGWVIAVMLPPMAIFFPLFTLLEDLGYLPRVAFNLDKYFRKAGAHGKQALTMAMGFGCNACGVMGCRIIDSSRERLIAILTNNFVPCNGRFPTLISIITMFFVGTAGGLGASLLSTLMLTELIVFGVILTLLVRTGLSRTLLKGMPSSFALELPPYRRPQVGKVIVRSIFDRTLFVLGRAMAVAAPAGLLIWALSNTMVGDMSILAHCVRFFDPFARVIGLDGVILMAFILGFPANEIVIPIAIMTYLATGSLIEMDNLMELKNLLVANGWTWITALCTMVFSLCHFPCGTTCWTIRKETGSTKWMALGFAIPTVVGILLCFVIATLARFCGLG